MSRDPPLDNPCPNSISLNVSHQSAIVWFTEQECMHVAGHTRGQPAPLGEDSRESSCPSVSKYNGIVLSQEKQRNAVSPVGRQDGTGASVVVFAWLDILEKRVPLEMFYIHVSSGASTELPGNTSAVLSVIATSLCAFVYFTFTRNGELSRVSSYCEKKKQHICYHRLHIWSCSIILILWHLGHT